MSTRDELANLIDEVAEQAHREDRICSPHEAADAILAAGYVRADGEEFVVRRNGITYPNTFATADEAREWAKGFAARSAETEVVRRLVGPWEVA